MSDVFRDLAGVAQHRGLTHGAARLYAILRLAARSLDAEGAYFSVTLAGLSRLQPGLAGKPIGATTLLKQMQELRKAGLVDLRGALPRHEPHVPAVLKVLSPPSEEVDLAAEICLQ